MKFYVRKWRQWWIVLSARGERISIHSTREKAEAAKLHYETKAETAQ